VGAVRLGGRRAADRSPHEPASVISCVLDADSGSAASTTFCRSGFLKRLAKRELPASILEVAAQELGRGGEGRQLVVLTF